MGFYANLSKTAQIMTVAVGVICLILMVAGLIIINLVYPFEKPLPFAFGLAIGSAQSVLKIILLDKSVNRTLEMEKERASNTARLHAIGRFFLTAAVLGIVIIFSDIFGLYGAIIGVISLQLALFVTNIIIAKQNKQEAYKQEPDREQDKMN